MNHSFRSGTKLSALTVYLAGIRGPQPDFSIWYCMKRSGVALKRAALAVLLVALLPPDGFAATFTVTKTADTFDGTCDSDCSLREAVEAANNNSGADTVIVPAGTFRLSLLGQGSGNQTGDLNVNDELTLTGLHAEATIIDGNGDSASPDRVFYISGIASISGVTI